jgi:hypothetical protein
MNFPSHTDSRALATHRTGDDAVVGAFDVNA